MENSNSHLKLVQDSNNNSLGEEGDIQIPISKIPEDYVHLPEDYLSHLKEYNVSYDREKVSRVFSIDIL